MRRALIVALLIAACKSDEGVGTEAPSPGELAPGADAIVKTLDTGPVKTTVTVWPGKPALGEPIYLRLAVEAPPGISVDLPFQQAGDNKLGRFAITSFTHEKPAQQTYVLEPPSSGKSRIPPMRLEMIDPTKGKPTEILTDEIPIDVAPMKDAQKDAEMRPPPGDLDTTVGGLSWIGIVGLASGVAILLSGGILLWRAMAAKRRIAEQRNAYDDAVAKLRELEAAPPTAEDADRWFVELSGVVRIYLEGRYQIRAPELTTEEFLQSVSQGGALTAAHRELLAKFLERCDEVKFAGVRPDSTESLHTLASARGFIEDTRYIAPTPASAPERGSPPRPIGGAA